MRIHPSKDLKEREAEVHPKASKHWYWPEQDDGAWDGPIRDWQNHHRHEYFKNLTNYDVVITAGANMGLHARAYAQMFGVVYAFEPDPLNFFCLTLNVPDDNVYKFQCALGESNGTGTLKNDSTQNMGTHTMKFDGVGSIPVLSIDSLNLKHCDLIQLDIEGSEEKVINGAMETITKFKPAVIVERQNIQINDTLINMGYVNQGASVSDHIFYHPETKDKGTKWNIETETHG